MTVALVPLGFTLKYCMSKSYDVERASKALLFSIACAVVEQFLPTETRIIVSFPLVLYVFFIVYQQLRSPLRGQQPLSKPVRVQRKKRRKRTSLGRLQRRVLLQHEKEIHHEARRKERRDEEIAADPSGKPGAK